MENGEPTKEQEKQTVLVGYDDPGNPSIMRISIPIGHFADHEIGTVLLKGFLDDIKEIGLQIIKNKRRVKMEAGKIIAPGLVKQPLNIIQ